VGQLVDWAPDAAVTVPPADPRALADAIAALLADEDRRLAIARRAHALALAEDADWTAARIEALYREVAGD
jgi:glycosyltransferase involved in cell wall biosynthesis